MADTVLSPPPAPPSICRLHVGNMSPAVTASELAEKFKAIGRVVDVYMPTRHQEDPSSSWKKGFAVVQVECDRTEVMKRAQPLNNTRWKGCTIHISLAKPYYKDALLATATNSTSADKPKAYKQRASVPEIKTFSGNVLRLRMGKGKRTIKVSPEPLLCYVDKQYCKPQGVLQALIADGRTSIQCPRRYILDEEMLRGADLQEVRPDALRPLTASSLTTKPTTAATSRLSTANSAAQEAANAKAKGTGVRKGFGTLMAAPLSHAVQKLALQDDSLPPSLEQDEPIDVSEEGLTRDRMRTLDLMKQILSSAPKPAMAPPPSRSKAPAASQTGSSAADASVTAKPPTKASDLPAQGRKEEMEDAGRKESMAEGDSEVCEEPNTASADLQGLKSIFHRKGGVQWGESETLHSTNQVVQGHGHDLIFLEAEKLGMEIRGQLDTAADAGKTMLFNFFGDAAPAPTAANQSDAVHGQGVGGEKDGEGIRGGLAGAVFLSGAEIASLCRRFCREESKAVLDQQWRNGREQLVRDYKKKRREMTKKVGARKKPKLS